MTTATEGRLVQRLLPRAKFAEIYSAGMIVTSIAWMVLAPVVGTFLDYCRRDYRTSSAPISC